MIVSRCGGCLYVVCLGTVVPGFSGHIGGICGVMIVQ